MKLNTKYHGTIDYNEDEIITFHDGLPGFEQLKKYILFPVEENRVFSVLHSIEDTGIGLVVISPFTIKNDYQLELVEEMLEKLKIKNEEQVLIVNTVTLNSKVEKITVNLKAPIVINIKERLGEQIILDNDEYLVKYPLVKE